LHQQPSPANYAELIASIREGDPFAVASFRSTFTCGIQFFIAQESNEIDILERVEQVVLSVIEEIRNGHIDAPNLPSRILESVRRNTGHGTLNRQSRLDSEHRPVTDASEVVVNLLKATPEREQEALKRYYVDLETENDICATLGLTVDQFRNSKSRFRTGFRKAEKSWRAT
jgi:hypothetical protein